MKSNLPLVSVGVLSYRAHRTLKNALNLHRGSGLISSAGEFFVHFNALCPEDEALACKAGVDYFGNAANRGIYNGFRSIVERAARPFVLILENDVVPLKGADVVGCLDACVADMREHGVKAFCLRSRANPGQGAPWRKYLRCFPVRDPIGPHIRAQRHPVLDRAKMVLEHGYVAKFRGAALFVEKAPEQAQPRAVRKLASGNYLTDSRFRSWSNQAVLVEREFFLNVICRRVQERPDPRLVNGHQNIERALNSWWWRRRKERLGQAGEGVFTHARLDR